MYIARDGVTTTDLFRRPGNPNDLKHIVKRLNDGRDIDYANYNFYTLASVIKVSYAFCFWHSFLVKLLQTHLNSPNVKFLIMLFFFILSFGCKTSRLTSQ